MDKKKKDILIESLQVAYEELYWLDNTHYAIALENLLKLLDTHKVTSFKDLKDHLKGVENVSSR